MMGSFPAGWRLCNIDDFSSGVYSILQIQCIIVTFQEFAAKELFFLVSSIRIDFVENSRDISESCGVSSTKKMLDQAHHKHNLDLQQDAQFNSTWDAEN